MMKRSLIVLVLAPAFLAGCGSAGTDSPTTDATTPVATTAPDASPTAVPTMAKSDVYVDAANSQAEGEFVGAFSDVASSSCERDGGNWTGSGTLLNPTGDKVDYRVWVAFLDSEGDTVGLVQNDVNGVEAGATGDYLASMPYADPDDLACVLRVERRVAP